MARKIESKMSKPTLREALIYLASGRRGQVSGAQRPRPIKKIGEGASTGQRSRSPAQPCLLILLFSIISLGSGSAWAEGNQIASVSEAFRLFTQCDASLFKALKENKNIFGSSVEVKDRGNAATITVDNPLSQKGREQVFKEPIQVNGLRLVAWRDEVSYDVELGGFLFWGFKAEGDLKTVAKKVNAVLPESGKLVDAGDSWVRPEIRMIGDPVDVWRSNRASGGTVSPKGSVERVLLLENEASGFVSIFCTLQGSITSPLLQTLRPDLTHAEYPQ